MPEHLLQGWTEIHEMLRLQKGGYIMSIQTLMKHRDEMKDLGVVMEMHIGRGKRPCICAWPSRIMWFFAMKQQEKRALKKLKSK